MMIYWYGPKQLTNTWGENGRFIVLPKVTANNWIQQTQLELELGSNISNSQQLANYTMRTSKLKPLGILKQLSI